MSRYKRHRRRKKTERDLYRHFRWRVFQRHGIEIEEKDYDAMVAMIQEGQGTFLWAESHTKHHWKIWWEDKFFRVVYDKKRGCLVTALPVQGG